MKSSTVCKIAFTSALAVAIAVLSVVAIRTVNPAAFGEFAENIPILKRFIVKTYPTRSYGMAESEANALKIARYDIDFLASFAGPDGRYVALYPFSVEAEIRLDKLTRKDSGRALAVSEMEYRAILDQEAAASMVFMDTLDLDYNKMIAPVLSMYREKCVDLTMNDTVFTAECRKKAESYLTDIFGANKIVWSGDANGAGGAGSMNDANRANPGAEKNSARPLPVEFRIEGDRGRTKLTAQEGSLRDAFTIRTTRFDAPHSVRFRFGRAGRMSGSFADFADRLERRSGSLTKSDGRIVFRYHDPMRDDETTFASFANSGYRSAFVYLRGGSDVYYVDAACDSEMNDEEVAQRIAPATLYLAASVLPFDTSGDARGDASDNASAVKRYDDYCRQYDSALADVKARRYGRQLELSLEALDRISTEQTGRASDDADIIRKILNLKNGSANPIAAIVENEAASLGPGMAEPTASADEDLRGNIEALLWSMRGELGIGDGIADGYKRDLVSKGSAINRSLAESLPSAERNELFANFFLAHLDNGKPYSLYVGENGDATKWLYYGAAAVEWKNKTGQRRVEEKLALKSGGGSAGHDGKFVFVFSDPEEKAGFFTQYHALVLDSDSVTYCRNFARWLPFTGGETSAKFGELEFTDGSVTIGKRSLDGKPEIARVLKPFRDAFSTDSYTKDRVAELAAGNLEKKAVALLERPRFN